MAGLAVLHHPVTCRHAVVDTERFHFSLDARVRQPPRSRAATASIFSGVSRPAQTSKVPLPSSSRAARISGWTLSPFIQADRSISALTGSPLSPDTQNQVETRLKGATFSCPSICGEGLPAGNR